MSQDESDHYPSIIILLLSQDNAVIIIIFYRYVYARLRVFIILWVGGIVIFGAKMSHNSYKFT